MAHKDAEKATRLIKRIKAGKDLRKEVPFPGTDEPVFLRVLTEGHKQQAQFAAIKHFRLCDIAIDAATLDAFQKERLIQCMYLAVRDRDGREIADSVTEFRDLLTSDELDSLADEYWSHEREVSPSPDNMSAEEFDALVDLLKKRPEETIGSVSSIATARRLLLTLVSRLQRSPKGNGS